MWRAPAMRRRGCGAKGDSALYGEPEEHYNRLTKLFHGVVFEAADASTQLVLGYCHQLVGHEPRQETQAVYFIRIDTDAHQRTGRRGRRQQANRGRISCVEAIVLNNHSGPRLTRILATACAGPNLAPSHLSSQSQEESDSMNAKSSLACGLRASARDWRRASLANSGERVSGTQICRSRIPCARMRARCAETFARVAFLRLAVEGIGYRFRLHV